MKKNDTKVKFKKPKEVIKENIIYKDKIVYQDRIVERKKIVYIDKPVEQERIVYIDKMIETPIPALKCCILCGGIPELAYNEYGAFVIRCNPCGLSKGAQSRNSAQLYAVICKAIDLWNDVGSHLVKKEGIKDGDTNTPSDSTTK